tara:strand:- start:374 stop:793 length:420 start_codon:yes stop_codon:yes gene_type:complete
MAATSANIGYTSTFGIEGETPGTYAVVAEVVSITPPGFSREAIDATHLNSDDRYKEFIAGMNEAGEASITLNFVPSATDVLVAAFVATTGNYQITFPNGVTMEFGGFCMGYELGELSNDKMTATATFKPSGKPTLTAAV